jgi:outer membrane protein OmpA-like peptidoglycan-associated protein
VKRLFLYLLAPLLALPAGLSAQSAGTIELTMFGNYTWYDKKLTLENQWGGGGTLGLFFVPRLALELEGGYTPTSLSNFSGRDVHSYPPRARLTYNIPLFGWSSAFQIGAGYVRSVYKNSISYEDNGITGLAGFRIGISEHFAFRLAGTLDYVPEPQSARLNHYMNWGTQAGISFLFGNRYDHDHDKIADKQDKCPNTPKGEAVDNNGCSATQRDSDHDGLADAYDKCPNTPANAQVDASGCSAEQRDTDHDGISDALDKCPNTAAGAKVDESGCSAEQRDSDKDGVSDAADKCPNTPAGESVNADGCALSQLDSDHDGVPDSKDKCPNTPPPAGQQPAGQAERGPAERASYVDEDGCSADQRDSDHDGVPDSRDKCPNTPAGQEVDENGCTRLFKGGAKAMTLLGAQFETGKAELTEASKQDMKTVAEALKSQPDAKIEIAGYTDNTGSAAANKKLSQARADAVMQVLVGNGVPQSQLTAKGYGPANAIASNKTADGRAKNRRVELHRLN